MVILVINRGGYHKDFGNLGVANHMVFKNSASFNVAQRSKNDEHL